MDQSPIHHSRGFRVPHSTIRPRAGVIPSLDGPQNIMGSGTYPRANFLRDGSIVGAYTAFGSGDNIITLAHSTDGGASWTQIGVADQGPTATTDKDNPYPIQLPSGRVLVAFRNHDRQDGTYTFFRITICASDDNGQTWEYLSTPTQDPGSVNGNWEPFMRIAGDGTLQLYYSRENSVVDQDSLMRTSNDGGATWSSATVISGAELSNARDGMLGVTSVSGSNLVAVFETETGGGTFHVSSVTSSDDGKTWGNRQVVYAPSNAGTNAQAPQVINVGGTLVASFMSDEDSPGNPAAKVVTSGDGGATWGNKLTFSDAVSHWPGLLTLDGSSFLGMADYGGAKARKVILI